MSRELLIQAQREHLEALALQESVFRGPCSTCRWRKGWETPMCFNPLVAQGKLDPTSGTVSWEGVYCGDQRQVVYERGYDRKVYTSLCGPAGTLWEIHQGWQASRRALFPRIFWVVPCLAFILWAWAMLGHQV